MNLPSGICLKPLKIKNKRKTHKLYQERRIYFEDKIDPQQIV